MPLIKIAQHSILPTTTHMKQYLPLLALLLLMHPVTTQAVTMAELIDTNSIPAPVAYGSNDPTIQIIVPFLPKDLKPGEKRPALVLIHGGSWYAPMAFVFYPMAKYFASRGVPTFCIDYRGIKKETNDTGIPEILSDCRSAMRFIRSHASEYGVDPERIAVLGDSAGGHLAACLGTIPEGEKIGGVSSAANLMILCNPIVDMQEGGWIKYIIRGKALEKTAQPQDLVPDAGQLKLSHDLSPQFFVSGRTAPALIMHGKEDYTVLPAQSQLFADTMKKAGVEEKLILIPGASHAFIVPKYTATEQRVIDATIQVEQFLARHGYVTGEPTLVLSNPSAWVPKPKKTPKPPASPSPSPSSEVRK